MAVRLLQPSFGGGEYDPGLWGRQDLGRYGTSGRLVRNWIVRATGGLETRPGSRFIGEVKNSAKPARVLPFQVTEALRSEEHTSELQSLMRISYAVFC